MSSGAWDRPNLARMFENMKRRAEVHRRAEALVIDRGLNIDTAIDIVGLLPDDAMPALDAFEQASDAELARVSEELGMYPPLYLWDSMPPEDKEQD